MVSENFGTRIDRPEWHGEIRPLLAKCALPCDMDTLVSAFPEEIHVGRHASGRLAPRTYMGGTLLHLTGGNTGAS